MSRRRQGHTTRRSKRNKGFNDGARKRASGRRYRRKGITPVFFIFVCLMVTAIGVFTLVQRLCIAESDIAIERAEKLIAEEQAQQEKLRVDLAALESPTRISRAAQEKLGMRKAKSLVYLSMKTGSLERIISLGPEDGGEKVGGGSEEKLEAIDRTEENNRLANSGRQEE